MDRRFLLKLFGFAPLGYLGAKCVKSPPEPPPEPHTKTKRVLLTEFHVAGFQYHRGMDPRVAEALRAGEALQLRREPENPHDESAIAVLTRGGDRLGYVPRYLNSVPCAIADQGIPLEAELVEFDPGAPSWERLCVRVFQVVGQL